jgi:hypothetical protein
MGSTNLTLSGTEDEVIKNVKNGSPGSRNTNLELMKCGRKVLAVETKLLNKILYRNNIPRELKAGYSIQICKKGDKRKCDNHRDINVTNPFIKI